jgi:hypothetical protein
MMIPNIWKVIKVMFQITNQMDEMAMTFHRHGSLTKGCPTRTSKDANKP